MSEFCRCGVTLMGDPGETAELCVVCAAAPHGRDCFCDECEEYWKDVCEQSFVAAAIANRRLVCSCGWTGAFIEHHRRRQPDCTVTHREQRDEAAARMALEEFLADHDLDELERRIDDLVAKLLPGRDDV